MAVFTRRCGHSVNQGFSEEDLDDYGRDMMKLAECEDCRMQPGYKPHRDWMERKIKARRDKGEIVHWADEREILAACL